MERGSETSKLHRWKLCRDSIWQEEHIKGNLQYWVSSNVLVQQEVEINCTQFDRSKVHVFYSSSLWGYMDEEDPCWVIWSADGSYSDLLWQSESYQALWESIFHDWSKHIDIWYHHLHHCVLKRIMFLEYIPTEENSVNIFEKGTIKMQIWVS